MEKSHSYGFQKKENLILLNQYAIVSSWLLNMWMEWLLLIWSNVRLLDDLE